MAWIKRNLFFVITVVAGLGASGYCGYLLYAAMQDSEAGKAQFESAQSALTDLQRRKPYPSDANIKTAQADIEQGQALLAGFQKTFASFPTPPKLTDRDFNDYLRKVIVQFGTEATNAGVGLPAGYQFSFSHQMDELDHPPGSVDLWMQELQEMQALLQMLYDAKINYLELIRRPSIGPEDAAGDEVMVAAHKPNMWGEVSTYTISFRAFSKEIADVMARLASSTNCFVLTAIYVTPSRVPLPETTQQETVNTPAARPGYQPAPQYSRPFTPYRGRPPGRPGNSYGGQPPIAPRPRPVPAAPQAASVPAAPAAPETILRETPLYVTMYIDLIKLNKPAAPAATAKPKAGGS